MFIESVFSTRLQGEYTFYIHFLNGRFPDIIFRLPVSKLTRCRKITSIEELEEWKQTYSLGKIRSYGIRIIPSSGTVVAFRCEVPIDLSTGPVITGPFIVRGSRGEEKR